ncbi:hypothetical protein CP061683_0185B, partial [Chlamydia psittaci 06-1683]
SKKEIDFLYGKSNR